MQGLVDRGGGLGGIAVMPLSQGQLKLLDRRGHCGPGSGIRLQKGQGRRLLQRAPQLQGHWVIGFETGGQLIDQASLHLDQTVLVAGQCLKFCADWAVRFQLSQLGEIRSANFCQQVRIDTLRLGSRCRPTPINRFGIDRIDRKSGFQQGCDQQAMVGFDDTSQLGFPLWATDGLQKGGSILPVLRQCVSPGVCRSGDRPHQ